MIVRFWDKIKAEETKLIRDLKGRRSQFLLTDEIDEKYVELND